MNDYINIDEELCDAIKNIIHYFDENDCKLSDLGLNYIYFESFTDNEVISFFKKK